MDKPEYDLPLRVAEGHSRAHGGERGDGRRCPGHTARGVAVRRAVTHPRRHLERLDPGR